MARFVGTSGKDNFKGGSGNDAFIFDVRNMSHVDKIVGGKGADGLFLNNSNSGTWASVGPANWAVMSGIDGVGLTSNYGAYGFKLAFTNAFYNADKVANFEILATSLTGVAQGLHVSASTVSKMAFTIAGTLGGEDKITTGSKNDVIIYAQNSLNIRDQINGGKGVDTLVLAGAGAPRGVKDGPTYNDPHGSTFLGNVKNIEKIVVTNLSANQDRSISFGAEFGQGYTGTGTVKITTDANYGSHKAAVAIDGKLIVDGTRLKADQIIDVTGGKNGDILYGGAGNDKLSGGAGNDTIKGGFGSDTMTGGAGADTFIFSNLNDSTPGARDVIADFHQFEGDKIFFQHTNSAPFSFIGAEAFHGVAGEIHSFASGGQTIVELDQNGDGGADFAIALNGNMTLTAYDFSL